MAFRTAMLAAVVAFHVPFILGQSAVFGAGESHGHYHYYAELSPWVVPSWIIGIGAYLLAIRGTDPYEFSDRRAGLIRRFLGFALDFHICLLLVAVPTIMCALAIESMLVGQFLWSIDRTERFGTDMYVALVLFVITLGTLIVLLSLPLSRQRRSIGAVVLGFGLRPTEPISLAKGCRRTIAGFITLCLGWISVPAAALRGDRRMWHDRAYNVFPLEVGSAA